MNRRARLPLLLLLASASVAALFLLREPGPGRASRAPGVPPPDDAGPREDPPAAPRTDPELHALVGRLSATLELAAHRPLITALLSSSPIERADAAQELGFTGDERLLPLLLHLLTQDIDPAVRASAADSLDQFDTIPEASRALARALLDPDPGVRQHAALGLHVHRNSTVETELKNMLLRPDLPTETRDEIALLLDRHYVRKDPLLDPLAR